MADGNEESSSDMDGSQSPDLDDEWRNWRLEGTELERDEAVEGGMKDGGVGNESGCKVRVVGRRLRWIIDERLSTSEDPNGTWWTGLRDSVTGFVARSGGVGRVWELVRRCCPVPETLD